MATALGAIKNFFCGVVEFIQILCHVLVVIVDFLESLLLLFFGGIVIAILSAMVFFMFWVIFH